MREVSGIRLITGLLLAAGVTVGGAALAQEDWIKQDFPAQPEQARFSVAGQAMTVRASAHMTLCRFEGDLVGAHGERMEFRLDVPVNGFSQLTFFSPEKAKVHFVCDQAAVLGAPKANFPVVVEMTTEPMPTPEAGEQK